MWVTLGNTHINMDRYSEFLWSAGVLKLFIAEQYNAKTEIEDPDQKLYRTLCNALCINRAASNS